MVSPSKAVQDLERTVLRLESGLVERMRGGMPLLHKQLGLAVEEEAEEEVIGEAALVAHHRLLEVTETRVLPFLEGTRPLLFETVTVSEVIETETETGNGRGRETRTGLLGIDVRLLVGRVHGHLFDDLAHRRLGVVDMTRCWSILQSVVDM